MNDADELDVVAEQPDPRVVWTRRGESSKPRLRRRLDGDLDVITLKALRKDPLRRYASVEQMAEDIRRHLEGLPLTAVPDSVTYRARKFVQRHKMGVLATLFVLVVVSTGVLATIREASIASANRRRAEQRFNDVRTLANSLIFEIHDSIESLPGSTPARKLIVERALEYLDSLAQEVRGDSSLQRELADAYKRIGDVQGGPFAANLGDVSGAFKSYQHAISIRQSLLATHDGNTDDRIGLAEAARLTAATLTVSGNTIGALEQTKLSVSTLEDLLPTNSSNLKLKRELMLDYGAEADVLASFLIGANFNNLSEALPLRRKQLELAEQLNSEDSQNPATRRSYANALNYMGDHLLLTGQRREASQYYSQAQPILENATTGTTNTKELLELHDTYYRLLPIDLAEANLGLAMEHGRRALSIAQQISGADSQNTQALVILAADFSNLAEVLLRTSHEREAFDAVSKALNIDSELSRRFPNSAQFRHVRHGRFQTAGDVSMRFGKYPQALRYYQAGSEILKGMQAENPSNKWILVELAMTYNSVGAVLLKTGAFSKASSAYQDALNLLSAQINIQASSEDALYGFADAATGLAEVEMSLASVAQTSPRSKAAHLRKALSWYDLSVQTWGRVREPGLVSPTGFNCIPLTVVSARRSRCTDELAKLQHPGAISEKAQQ